MSYKVLISDRAHNDIDTALDYITNVLCNPIAARSLLKKIEESYTDISYNPYAFAYCNDERLKGDGYRKIIINKYMLIYRIGEENKTVYVVRFFYGGRNYTELL